MARTLKLQSEVVDAATPEAIRDAFTAMAKRRPGAAIVLSDPLFFREAQNLVRIAAEQRLPVMYALREIVAAGGASVEVRAGDQPHHREGARSDDPPGAPGPSRRGHPLTGLPEQAKREIHD